MVFRSPSHLMVGTVGQNTSLWWLWLHNHPWTNPGYANTANLPCYASLGIDIIGDIGLHS